MRAVATLVILGVLAMRLDGPATLIAQDRPIPKSADSKSTDGVKDIVATFFKNWKQGQATRNQSLFVNADIPVVGFGPDHRPGQLTAVRQKTAEHVLKEWEANPPQYLVTDSIEVDRLGGSLAAARHLQRFRQQGPRGFHALLRSRDVADCLAGPRHAH